MAQKLTFTNRDGDALVARLDRPVDGEPLAYALFAHCFTCTKNLRAVGHLSRSLTEQGIAVLRFDFTGLGESEGEFADTTFSSNVEDLVAAARFLEAEYEAPQLLVGHSLGGAAVIQAADVLPSVRAVATLGAPFDPGHVRGLFAESADEIARAGKATVDLGGRPFTIKKAFLDDLETHHVQEVLGRLGRALLVLHSPLDETVGIENARLIYEAARHPKSFVTLDDADHLLSDEADARYAGAVLGVWARRYLSVDQPAAKAGPPDDNRVVARIGRDRFRTEILANGHTLVTDEPASVGGTNLGPSPYDLLVAALGACTAMTLRMYADHKGWALDAAVVRLHHRKVHKKDCEACDDRKAKVDHVERTLELSGDLDDAQRARLLEVANRCPVHRTLEGEVEVSTTLAEPGAQAG